MTPWWSVEGRPLWIASPSQPVTQGAVRVPAELTALRAGCEGEAIQRDKESDTPRQPTPLGTSTLGLYHNLGRSAPKCLRIPKDMSTCHMCMCMSCACTCACACSVVHISYRNAILKRGGKPSGTRTSYMIHPRNTIKYCQPQPCGHIGLAAAAHLRTRQLHSLPHVLPAARRRRLAVVQTRLRPGRKRGLKHMK